jgi:hypothetical protein
MQCSAAVAQPIADTMVYVVTCRPAAIVEDIRPVNCNRPTVQLAIN